MLAIPLTKQLSWRNPPVITIILILTNIFIYVLFQTSDTEKLMEAREYYIDSGLAKMEVTRFVAYANERSKAEEDKLTYPPRNEEQFAFYIYKMESNSEFMGLLLNQQVITKQDPAYHQWLSMRWDYDMKMNRVVSWGYGFRPAKPRAITWFTSMFLHGSWGHLIGNMIFLWLIGVMIEYGCGRLLFLLIYILGGLAAVGFFASLNLNSQIPLIGASGAISGIMGAFCALYGLKNVRIFLTLGFYFNYIKFPALLMLPLWIGNEVLQMATDEGSHVAYAAHIGGLVGGALFAFVLRKIPRAIDSDAFEEEKPGADKMIEEGLRHIRNLDFDAARELLLQARSLEPENLDILQHLFRISKHSPGAEHFHQAARTLLHKLCQNESTHAMACDTYREYIQHARPPRLTTALYIRLSGILASSGEVKEAKNLLALLLKKAPQEPGLPSAFLKLSKALNKLGMKDNSRACLDIITKRFPGSPEAQIARRYD